MHRAPGGIEVADGEKSILIVGQAHAVQLAWLTRLEPQIAGPVFEARVQAGFSM
jgi:hypothetical protein